MKIISLGIGVICFGLVILAAPAGITYGVYQWAVADVEFKMALWMGVKTWLIGTSLVVPGLIGYIFGSD